MLILPDRLHVLSAREHISKVRKNAGNKHQEQESYVVSPMLESYVGAEVLSESTSVE